MIIVIKLSGSIVEWAASTYRRRAAALHAVYVVPFD